MTNINGTLRNARRLSPSEDLRGPCLQGEVYGDTKGRFYDGESIVTSTIMSEEGDVFRTRYSAYKVESWAEPALAAANDNRLNVHPDILKRYENAINDQMVTVPRCEPDPGTSLAHLLWMLGELRTDMPADKAGRWLGFIQGCLVMRGLASVQAERDFTRPYFTARAAA